ncbi:TRAP transporter large permease [Roseinatronobacter alkalisoli]|uniref:TRAP transporter large permease protein n=1 Tax=Roseinatronobacter alkalisoli TaxID=3028235 RepID=A0ABT5TCF4_9RHOB|nr:TRAP transporter large permease [Roseinatronobacter sp. HJB301]MDD7972681.1 TRAP transporter large permease [Roseinatronobacter sp. HJB301]
MAPELVGAGGFVALLALIALRAPIGLALMLVGGGGLTIIQGTRTLDFVAGQAPVSALMNYTLSTLPMFLFMGVLAVRIGMAERLYDTANTFVRHRRGGLAMASVLSCGGFGAVCGSSVATVTTMARIAVPPMLKNGYSPRLAGGSIAAGTTLGILIPPSLPLIVYAILTETSIGKLFAAGIIPGIVAMLLYVFAVWVWTRIDPQSAPVGLRAGWRERIAALGRIGGVLALFLLVMGGIFIGLFTPSEGAAIGAAGAMVIGLVTRTLTPEVFRASVVETVQLSTMIIFIVLGVTFYEYFLQASRIPNVFVGFVEALDLSPLALILLLVAAFVLLGCVLDSMAILFIFTPVIFPLVLQAGFDPVWFGIIMVMVIEFGLVTPPIGLNIFLLSRVTPQISMTDAFVGVVPFIAVDVLRLALFIAFPGLVLFLPGLLFD